MAVFLFLHYLALALATWSGNFDPNPNHDHVRVMRHVLEGGIPRVAIWPPGFGYYLALKWEVTEALELPYWTAKLFIDVFLMVAAGVLATLLGQALTRNRWLAVAAGVGQVGAPIFLLSSAEDLAMLLFQPFFLFSLLVVARQLARREGPRAGGFALAGAIMGLACLVRGNPQFLVVLWAPLTLWVLCRGKLSRPWLWSARVLMAFVVAQFLVLAPWLLHQRNLGEDGMFSTPGVYYAFLDGIKRHRGHPISDWLAEHYDEVDQSMASVVCLNLKWMREEPLALGGLYALKFLRSWYLSDSGAWDRWILLFHAPMWLLALVGLRAWLRRGSKDPALIFTLLVLGYMWTVSALFSGLARYSGPLYGLIGLLAGIGVCSLGRGVLLGRKENPTDR